MIIRKGDYFKVRTFFKYDGNSFFKGDLLRIVFHRGDLLRVIKIYDSWSKVLVSNKSWITTKAGHTDTENQYSFGRGTNWNIPINYIEEGCIPVNPEWE